MNAKLLPFKNGDHNSESASTIDGAITPLIWWVHIHKGSPPSLGLNPSSQILSPSLYHSVNPLSSLHHGQSNYLKSQLCKKVIDIFLAECTHYWAQTLLIVKFFPQSASLFLCTIWHQTVEFISRGAPADYHQYRYDKDSKHWEIVCSTVVRGNCITRITEWPKSRPNLILKSNDCVRQPNLMLHCSCCAWSVHHVGISLLIAAF